MFQSSSLTLGCAAGCITILNGKRWSILAHYLGSKCSLDSLNKTDVVLSLTEAEDREAATCKLVEATS